MKIKVSPKFQTKWEAFRKALDEAANPFTNDKGLPLSPFYAHNIGGNEELDKVLKTKPAGTTASFSQDNNRQLYIELN